MSRSSLIFKIILSLLVVLIFFVDLEQSTRIVIGTVFIILLFAEEMYERKIKKSKK